MRAVQPRIQDELVSGGVRIAYEVFGNPGDGGPAVVFVPTDAIVSSQTWKAQAPYLSRHAVVVTIDPPGNGRSGRCTDPAAYSDTAYARYVVDVMDAAGVESAVLVGICGSAWCALVAAAKAPNRVRGVVTIGLWAPGLVPRAKHKEGLDFDADLPDPQGWQKLNRHHWRRDLHDFATFFFAEMLPEPHSSKQFEDTVGWALDAGPDVLLAEAGASVCCTTREETEALLAGVRCPVLTMHGDRDMCQQPAISARVAELTGGRYVELPGSGHLPMARDPVTVNELIRSFLGEVYGATRPRRPRRGRRPRALVLSSPIGLGHSRRDIAITEELRRLRPEVEVDWLAQHPLTTLLADRRERIHPASGHLATESAHIEAECGEHDLHAFQAIRRMDEILVHNFMVFADLVEREEYDVWIADEAWELDHFLHENPRLKRAPFAWLTDFVGWLPMPDGGAREAALTADYNAEMVDHIARHPSLRDLSLFVGDPEDVVPDPLGPGLPTIRQWTAEHFDFVGHVSGFDPAGVNREEVRAAQGWAEDETVCLVTVGGSGVGRALLERVAGAFPDVADTVPGLRMVVVAGPRIDPDSVKAPAGLEVRGYVPDLHRVLTAADVAVVQGGLTTTMELTAARRPFVYVPLRHHFEQNHHVRFRLDRYRAGHCLLWDDADPGRIAELITRAVTSPADYLPVATDGARRAAERIAALL
jgi:pimeloyl-ACP methyl ester carboxylesterase/predicted glycosyltransferase